MEYTTSTDWLRVSRDNPCPVCGKPDWCMVAPDGGAAICARIESDRPRGDAGWLHVLQPPAGGNGRRNGASARQRQDAPTDWTAIAKQHYHAEAAAGKRQELAEALGVSAESLQRLGTGWDGSGWTVPEWDSSGTVIGISRRFPSGGKAMAAGSKRGLTYSRDWSQAEGPAVIVEGASDVAAGMDLELPTIGRPSNSGGMELLADLLADWPAERSIIVLGEHDAKADGSWPGRDGAQAVAAKLAEALQRKVCWSLPPDGCKDLRTWYQQSGAPGKANGLRLLKRLDVQTTEIGKKASDNGGEQAEKKSQATQLVELALGQGIELWHSPGDDGDGFATIPAGEHNENRKLSSKAFRTFLRRLYWQENEKSVGSEAVQGAIGVLQGMALFDGSEHETYVRVAEYNGSIYLDLGDEKWQSVKITQSGWELVSNPPVKFLRPRGTLPLPTPKQGDVAELRQVVNVSSDEDWTLLVAWLVAALRPSGPYPVLAINGEQGSAKSTTCRMLRSLVDPRKAGLRSEPKEPRDLMIAAESSWMVGYENLSSLPVWLSDCLCRLATGGGFGTRELYTDGEEKLFDATRPVLLNGINQVATRGDLLDRMVTLTLPAIPEDQRKDESEIMATFEKARPRILSGLLDCVSTALRNVDSVRLERRPRMADFATWATAAEPAFGEEGAFLAAYSGNRQSANESVIENSLIAEPLLRMLGIWGDWSGTAGELLEALEQFAEAKTQGQKGWPSRPHLLSRDLKRIAPNLRSAGWEVVFDRQAGTGKRLIRIVAGSSVTSVTSVTSGDLAGDDASQPASQRHNQRHTEPPVNPGQNDACDARDGCDAKSRDYSSGGTTRDTGSTGSTVEVNL